MTDLIFTPGSNHSNSARQQHDYLPYWTCQDKIFRTKFRALLHATTHGTNIEFRFNDEILDRLDWTKEPPNSIDYYYDLRAQSIRESYDYVVIMYSGGSDSSTVLKSFLRQKLPIDEIATYGLWADGIDQKSILWNQEILYAGADLLDQCAESGIKVTHLNLFDGIHRLDTDDWIWNSDPLFMATQAIRYPVIFQREDLRRRVEQGQKVCLIFGHDKSKIVVEDNSFYHAFLDVGGLGTGIFPELFAPDYVGPTMELFHTNIEVPEIMIKQSHLMAKWYWENFGTSCREMLKISSFDPNYSSRFNTICYPTTWRELETYSLGKGQSQNEIGYNLNPLSKEIRAWAWKCEWLYEDLKNTRWHENWQTGLKKAFDLLDPKFVKRSGDSLVGHWSKFRKIADFTG